MFLHSLSLSNKVVKYRTNIAAHFCPTGSFIGHYMHLVTKLWSGLLELNRLEGFYNALVPKVW